MTIGCVVDFSLFSVNQVITPLLTKYFSFNPSVKLNLDPRPSKARKSSQSPTSSPPLTTPSFTLPISPAEKPSSASPAA